MGHLRPKYELSSLFIPPNWIIRSAIIVLNRVGKWREKKKQSLVFHAISLLRPMVTNCTVVALDFSIRKTVVEIYTMISARSSPLRHVICRWSDALAGSSLQCCTEGKCLFFSSSDLFLSANVLYSSSEVSASGCDWVMKPCMLLQVHSLLCSRH